MSTVRHTITVGDTLTPLGAQLLQKNASGIWEAIDLTSKTVKFRMVDDEGTVIVDDTESNVTVEDAENGKVSYDFQDADVATAGIYYGWFRVFSGSERDTYPVDGRTLEIVVVDAA